MGNKTCNIFKNSIVHVLYLFLLFEICLTKHVQFPNARENCVIVIVQVIKLVFKPRGHHVISIPLGEGGKGQTAARILASPRETSFPHARSFVPLSKEGAARLPIVTGFTLASCRYLTHCCTQQVYTRPVIL